MLGDFFTRGLVLVLGYAYPAFECFKTVEKNRVEIEELQFWCQYWIIVAVFTVFERIGDIFISWLPMYGEMKLAMFIYLWYPKTKGTSYIYKTFLRPYISKHETEIDRKLQELRVRAWDLATYYWQNCTKIGQSTFIQALQYMAAQSGKITTTKPNDEQQQQHKNENPYPTAAAPPSSPTGSPAFHHRMANKHRHPSSKRGRPLLPPTSLGTANHHRFVANSPKSEAGQVHLHSQAEFIHTTTQEEPEPSSGSEPSSTDEKGTGVDNQLHAARLRLCRSKGFH
ncbi:hypothetical protein CsSME_00007461 [Camellia sinensis var. sinensis]